MHVKKHPIVKSFLIFLFTCHILFLEDNYATGRPVFFLYERFAGFTFLDIFLVILFMITIPVNSYKIIISKETLWLFKLYTIAIIISYLFAYYKGNLFGGGLGTGLLEARVYFILIVLYLMFKLALQSNEIIIDFFSQLWKISSLGALLFLLFYLIGIRNFNINTGSLNIITFEGSLLLYWNFFFCYSIISFLFTRKKVYLFSGVLFLTNVIICNRRFSVIFIVMALLFFSYFYLRFGKNFRMKLSKVIILLLFAVLSFSIFNPNLISRINPVNFFDETSAEYQKNIDSNVGHYNDIIVGYLMVKNNFIFGIGPGAIFENKYSNLNNSILSGIHMLYYQMWLKLGLLGFLALVFYFYYVSIKSYAIQKNTSLANVKILTLTIFLYTSIVAVLSVIGINIIGSNKMQFMTVLLLVATENITLFLDRQKKAEIDFINENK